jgi:hypothetical protein
LLPVPLCIGLPQQGFGFGSFIAPEFGFPGDSVPANPEDDLPRFLEEKLKIGPLRVPGVALVQFKQFEGTLYPTISHTPDCWQYVPAPLDIEILAQGQYPHEPLFII